MTDHDLREIEEKIGYKFNNPLLLRQAFTSPSVTAATGNMMQNYQILEFIGDSVLSLMRLMSSGEWGF